MDRETRESLQGITDRLYRIECQLFNKLTIAKIIDISDDKVHKVLQVINHWETPDGVIIHVK
jgi:hypothetical protein